MKKLAIGCGIAYVLAWVIGLALASSGPKPDASASRVTSYFARHEHTAMGGHLFVDGIAGLALIGIALLVLDLLGKDRSVLRLVRLAFFAGLAAAAVSLAQFVVGETFTYDAAHGGNPSTVRSLFVTLNNLDTVKIVLLAIMIGAVGVAGRRTGTLPRWFTTSSIVFAPLLAISGFAFPFNNGALLASLDVTLLLLLLWAATFTTLAARRIPRETTAEARVAAT